MEENNCKYISLIQQNVIKIWGDMNVKNKKVLSPELVIEKGTIVYGNTLLQVKNISKISIEPMESKKFPYWSLVGLLVCIRLLSNEPTYGFIGIMIFSIPVLLNVLYNIALESYVVFSLNSGEKIYLSSKNENFLEKAVNYINNAIKEGENLVINFNNCNINGSKLSKGDIVEGNKIINGDNSDIVIGNHNNVNHNEDWEKLEKYFMHLLYDYEIDSEEYSCCEQAAVFCQEKNANQLKKLILKYEQVFENIVVNIASTGIIEALKNVTGIWF